MERRRQLLAVIRIRRDGQGDLCVVTEGTRGVIADGGRQRRCRVRHVQIDAHLGRRAFTLSAHDESLLAERVDRHRDCESAGILLGARRLLVTDHGDHLGALREGTGDVHETGFEGTSGGRAFDHERHRLTRAGDHIAVCDDVAEVVLVTELLEIGGEGDSRDLHVGNGTGER